MNIAYFIAGILCLFGAVFHERVGTKKIAIPIMYSNLDDRIKTIARTVWHAVTFLFAINCIFLFVISFGDKNIFCANMIILYLLSFAALFLYFSKTILGKAFFFIHPIFFTINALIILFGNYYEF